MTSAFRQKALHFATKAHKGQKRSSGEPFITHLIAVADLLKNIGADDETLVAALLHDTLEDTPVTAAQLKKHFGAVVTHLVEGVTKVDQVEKTFDKQQRNMESLRKMFRAMGKDIRALFIKVADRLHNMRTIEYVPSEKRIRVARETQDIYCPLAHLLGIRSWFEELSDHCFAVLDPNESELVRRKFAQTWKQQHRSFEKWTAQLLPALQKMKTRVKAMEVRRRHFREIRSFSVDQEQLLQQIETFHVVHIVVGKSESCYKALGDLHMIASPVPGGIDDFIAAPKLNGYQGLHTIVLTNAGNPITVVIQTEEMFTQARLGMALLYESTAKNWWNFMPDWVEALLTLDESEQDLRAFFQRIQSEVFGEWNHVGVVVNGKKKWIDLPAYASVLDLAFYGNERVGGQVESATINGKAASLKQLIRDGDHVTLATAKEGHPRNAFDLYFIHTALGHKHLVSTLSQLPKKEQIRRGGDVLQKALSFTMDPFFNIAWQKEVSQHVSTEPDILQKIGSGILDAFMHVEEHGRPEEFFLLDAECFRLPAGMRLGTNTRYVLRASVEELRVGDIVGVQAGPDLIEVVTSSGLQRAPKRFSHEIVQLHVQPDHVDFPFTFAIKWSFLPETNPLRDIAVLESFLDTPVHLLQFAPASVTLGFRTDRLRTLQIAYKYLYSTPHIIDLFRITP